MDFGGTDHGSSVLIEAEDIVMWNYINLLNIPRKILLQFHNLLEDIPVNTLANKEEQALAAHGCW